MNPEKPEQETDTRSDKSGLPWDMKIVLLWTALGILTIIIPVINQPFLRLILALPMILFIPGYVLVAALFPDTADIDMIERLVFSIGASIVVTPLIVLLLNFTLWGIRLEPVLITLTIFVVAMIIIATFRRSATPPESRYNLPIPEILRHIRYDCTRSNQSPDSRLSFFICIFAILLLIVSTLLVISLPNAGDKFTEFYILGENRTAGTYPEMISPGVPHVMYTGVGNHEYRTINYTVEIYLVPMNVTAATTSSPPTLLKSYSVSLGHNQTSILPLEFSVPSAGSYRMEYLLFNELVPGSSISEPARVNASYRNLHLWINATVPAFVQNDSQPFSP
jgi:uncharacterized membrane protein